MQIILTTTATNELKFNYPIHMGDRARQSHRQFVYALTNRQLLREYRQVLRHFEDVNKEYFTGGDWYLGERIGRVRSEAIISKLAYEFEVKRRYNLGLISTNK